MYCPKCGTENPDDTQICRSCSWVLTSISITAQNPNAKTSGLAITSLVLGILSIFTLFLTALPAIILGIISIFKIEKSAGQLKGKGLAIAGIAVPGASLLFIMVPAMMIAIMPALTKARVIAQRATGGSVSYDPNIILALNKLEATIDQRPNNLTDGLVAWYKVDDRNDTNTVIDSSIYANDGKFSGSNTKDISVDGVLGPAFDFTSSQFITIPNASQIDITSAPLSIFMWIKPHTSSEFWIMQKGKRVGGIPSMQYGLKQDDDGYLEAWLENQPRGVTDTPIPVNEWSFVGFGWDGAHVQYYINARPCQVYAGQDYSGGLTSQPEFYIGKGYYGGSQIDYINGSIDDVRIYNRPLSQSEITELYYNNCVAAEVNELPTKSKLTEGLAAE